MQLHNVCNASRFTLKERYINIFFVITNVITLKVETQKKYGYDKS